MAGQWTVSYLSAGLPAGGQISGTTSIIGSSVVGETLYVSLAPGDNTFTVPAGAVSVQIVPPSANGTSIKVRTNLNSTDAGMPISETDPWGPYSFRGLAVTSIIVSSAAAISGVQITFI